MCAAVLYEQLLCVVQINLIRHDLLYCLKCINSRECKAIFFPQQALFISFSGYHFVCVAVTTLSLRSFLPTSPSGASPDWSVVRILRLAVPRVLPNLVQVREGDLHRAGVRHFLVLNAVLFKQLSDSRRHLRHSELRH